MNTLPKIVTIGGVDLRIIVRETGDDYGSCHFDRREIWISDAATVPQQMDTLRHEMMHAALAIGGVGYSEKYDEEPIVRCLENIFFPAWLRITQEQNP